MKIFRRILPFAKPLYHFIPEYVIYTFLGIVFGLVNFALLIPILDLLFNSNAVSTTVAPIAKFELSITYIKSVFNYYLTTCIVNYGKFYALVFVCAIVGVSIIFSNIFRYLAVRVLIRLRLKIMNGVRLKLMEKYMCQSLSFHHNNTKGESLMLMNNEVQEIESSIVNSFQVLLRDPFVIIAYFCMLLYWSSTLTLFTLIFLPISGILISLLTKKLKKLSYFSQEVLSSIISFTTEALTGIRQIQIFNAEKKVLQKFEQMNNDFNVNSKKLFSKKELASPISEIMGVVTALTLIIFGGYLILNGKAEMDGKAFLSYLVLYTQLIQPLKNISQISGNLQRGVVACERIFNMLDAPIDIVDAPIAKEKHSFENGIEISNVSFAYNQKKVIDNLSLKVPKNKVVALVGSSGSGKSTLVDLICRFYDVIGGEIKIDGVNIKEIKLKSLRKHISLVSQSPFLFNDTIANNIAFGTDNASKEQIIEAAKIANAHQFIINTENGYDTMVGETGVKLSGGQRQRITIARAILKNAPILILDEATSALDTESEKLVQDAINTMINNKTSIIIAHRLSTVKHADIIVVMQDGKIVEQGNHEMLLELNGLYKRLVDMQEIS